MNNELKPILARVDHTLLSQTATWDQIRAICDDGIRYGCASVCIPASYVKQAAEYVAGQIAVCTVIGFPNGYDTTASKCFQATDAVNNGASEIDMVINIGWVKDGLYDRVLDEIRAVKAHCQGKLLKVIIETCLLTDAEKIEMCRVVSQSGAEYIKTSTGFGGGGATREDVALFKAHVAPHVKIKAAGGIANPVSYTHLDVYKRQFRGSAPAVGRVSGREPAGTTVGRHGPRPTRRVSVENPVGQGPCAQPPGSAILVGLRPYRPSHTKPVKKLEKLFNRFCMRRHSVFSHAARAHSARDS